MQPFTVSYTKAINKAQGRVWPLFQGPFRARAVTTDGDLIHLSRYIHLNPVSAGLVMRPDAWEYSSFRDYIGTRDGTLPRPQAVLCHFPSAEAYRDYVCSDEDRRSRLTRALMIDE